MKDTIAAADTMEQRQVRQAWQAEESMMEVPGIAEATALARMEGEETRKQAEW